MKIQEYKENYDWQGLVNTQKITEEILQENLDWTLWGTLPGDLRLYDDTGLEIFIREESDGNYLLLSGE
tara:strand:+ start:27296 stop:27502 length:207 start_codon:yes stop_codon:yes gene_type:complete